MERETSYFPEEFDRYFDISHSFKIGLSTYHILELRKSRPDNENNYFIFNCDNHSNEYSRNSTTRRSTNMFDQIQHFGRRPHSIDINRHKSSSFHGDSSTLPKTPGKCVSLRHQTQSPKKLEIDTTKINEMFVRTIKSERQAILSSMRKEMNVKNRTIIRTMKKQNKTLLDATKDESKGTEIIRLLEEQRKLLVESYEKCIESTVSSIKQLKETLIEKINGQNQAFASVEQIQKTIIQTIENQVQKVIEMNQQILNMTSTYNKSISQLESNLNLQLREFSTSNKNETKVIENLLQTHKNSITQVIVEQQQNLPIDHIRTAVVDALNEQSLAMPAKPMDSNDPFGTRADQVFQNMKTSNKNFQDLEFIKLSINSPPQAQIYPKLSVDGVEYSRHSYTLCQPDAANREIRHFYIAPPAASGFYEIKLYAKSIGDSMYRAAVTVAFPGLNLRLSNGLPQVHPAFEKHRCILIEPFRRSLNINDEILVHMIIPKAQTVKIRNGNDLSQVEKYEFQDYTLKKKLKVRGKVEVLASWDGKTDVIICVFN